MAEPAPAPAAALEADRETVERLLGRRPLADFDVVVRRADGDPVVIRNAPLLADGRPMPTRFWLVDPELNRAIGRLEAEGGVDRAEVEVDPDALARAHRRYAAERDRALPDGHVGPRPSGGVGGTRTGVKCLHTHYAHFLATGDDPVGAWVAERLPEPSARIGRSASTRGPDTVGPQHADSGDGTSSPPAPDPEERPGA